MSLTNSQIYNNTGAITVTPNSTYYTVSATSASLPYTWAVQSAAQDFGATRASQWLVSMTVNVPMAPTAGQTVDVYMGWATAAAATFPAGLGATPGNGYYSGYGISSITSAVPQLEYIGSMYLAPYAGNQISNIGVITPKLEFGVVVVVNSSGTSLGSTGGPAAAILTFTPITDEVGV